MASTLIDTAIIVLLAGVTAYGFVISRKVQRLMASLAQLEPLVREFSDAVDKSEESVELMRENLDDTNRRIEARPPPTPTPPEAPVEPQRVGRPVAGLRARPEQATGMRSVRDKKALVQMFFDASRTESRA